MTIEDEVKIAGEFIKDKIKSNFPSISVISKFNPDNSNGMGYYNSNYLIKKQKFKSKLGTFFSKYFGKKLVELNNSIIMRGRYQNAIVYDSSLKDLVNSAVEELNLQQGTNYKFFNLS